jgi:hypothetical protein
MELELWRRVNLIAEQLGLGIWHLTIDERPEDEGPNGDYADIEVDDLEARITFYKLYYSADTFMQLHVIVHELLHCTFSHLDDALSSLPTLVDRIVKTDSIEVRRELGKMLCETFEEQFELRVDRLVDQIARTVVMLNEGGGLS